MKYLIVLFASLALISCTNQKPNKSQNVMQGEADPSYAIMKNVNDNNRMIGNTISTIPNPSPR